MSAPASNLSPKRLDAVVKPSLVSDENDTHHVDDFFCEEEILSIPQRQADMKRVGAPLAVTNIRSQNAAAVKPLPRLALGQSAPTAQLPPPTASLRPKPIMTERKPTVNPTPATPKQTVSLSADLAFTQWAKRLTPAWWPSLGALEYTALTFLLLGLSVLMVGAYRNLQAPSNVAEVTPIPAPEISVASLAHLMPIPTAYASVGSKREPITAVFAHPWQKFINRLESKHYTIVYSQQLHPRLYLIQLAKGVEINLLLSQNEKEVEEVSLRLHMLEANEPVHTYRQIMADMQDILVDGALQQEAGYFQKLNLPLNLYSVPLPYAATYTSPLMNAELQILDPIYLNLRFVPAHSPPQNLELSSKTLR